MECNNPLSMDALEKTVHRLFECVQFTKHMSSLHSCNDCGCVHLCLYEPKWGEPVRYNCPHWTEPEKEGNPHDHPAGD